MPHIKLLMLLISTVGYILPCGSHTDIVCVLWLLSYFKIFGQGVTCLWQSLIIGRHYKGPQVRMWGG